MTSPSMKVKSSSRMCSMFCRDAVSRLSRQITLCFWASRCSQRCDPRKPAPPVTTEVGMTEQDIPGPGRFYPCLRRFYRDGRDVWLPQLAVRLHVEQHREEREEQARDQQQRN